MLMTVMTMTVPVSNFKFFKFFHESGASNTPRLHSRPPSNFQNGQAGWSAFFVFIIGMFADVHRVCLYSTGPPIRRQKHLFLHRPCIAP